MHLIKYANKFLLTRVLNKQPKMTSLKNKVAVITGGSTGIGLATAKLFSNQGAKVIITGRNHEALESAKASTPDIMIFQGDVGKLADLDKLFKEVHNHYDKIDILFANAGAANRVSVDDVNEKDFDWMTNVNYKGAYFTVNKAAPYLNKGASVILNASIAGVIGLTNHSIYSSNKAAVIQLAKNFAADLVGRRIRVNAISPGYIKTPIWDQWLNENPDLYQSLSSEVPLEGRFGSAEEIANVALFLASDASSYITAQNLIVDGGLSDIFKEHPR